jgi:FKBP-type peptidyl-prolyl cis-trans isomerase FkpA
LINLRFLINLNNIFMIRKNFRTIGSFIAIIIIFLVVSCKPSGKLAEQETEEIQQYLDQNSNLNFVVQPSGLYYLEVVPGTGASPVLYDSVYVKYTGKYLDGTIFDSNVTTGGLYRCIVGERNISGFDEGVTLMKQGGKSSLLIPSRLGYGPYGQYPIPGYTPLLFDIELVKVIPHTAR